MSNKGPSLSDNKGPAANLVRGCLLCFTFYVIFCLLQVVFETDPKLDHAPIVRHVALSSIEFGHKKAISDIQWVPSHMEVPYISLPYFVKAFVSFLLCFSVLSYCVGKEQIQHTRQTTNPHTVS